MTDKIKLFKSLVQTLAFVFFIMQMIFAIRNYLTKPTMSSPGHKSLMNLGKSILIAVCKNEQFDFSRASELGYKSSTDFWNGKTTDKTVISWIGLHGNLTFDEAFSYLYKSDLENIKFKTAVGTVTKRILIPLGLCKVFEGSPVAFMEIHVKSTDEVAEYFAFVTDPDAVNPFQLPYFLLAGDKVSFRTDTNSSVKKYAEYNIKLEETRVETEDGSCADYPDKTYASYSDCVGAEMRGKIFPVLRCMVPWMSSEEHCSGLIQRLPEHGNLSAWINAKIIWISWGGIQYKPETCLPPCTTFSVKTTFQQSGIYYKNWFGLYFEEDIKVHKV